MYFISNIFILKGLHKHSGVHKSYLYKRTLKINNQTIPSLIYCDICGIYMCSKELYEKNYENKFDNKLFKQIRNNDYVHDTNYIENKLDNINLSKLSSFEFEHKKHRIEKKAKEYNDNIYILDYCIDCDSYGIEDKYYDLIKENVLIKNPIKTIRINKYFNYDLRNYFYTNHLNHKLIDVILLIDDFKYKTQYCEECDTYNIDEKIFNKYFEGNYNGKVIRDYENKNISHESEIIEFLIKINTFRCKSKNHTIEEILAVVNVFNEITGNTLEVEIPAFYCKNCNLYYIYNSEYEELLKFGVPTCPVYEELKYFSNKNSFESFESDSLLKQFGYNVNAKDMLSNNERRRIINTVINNGIMNKNEVLSLLNFLASSRKNLCNMQNAVSKWESDIKYTRELNIENFRKVKVGAFKKKV